LPGGTSSGLGDFCAPAANFRFAGANHHGIYGFSSKETDHFPAIFQRTLAYLPGMVARDSRFHCTILRRPPAKLGPRPVITNFSFPNLSPNDATKYDLMIVGFLLVLATILFVRVSQYLCERRKP
jgi:hypothetical protein